MGLLSENVLLYDLRVAYHFIYEYTTMHYN